MDKCEVALRKFQEPDEHSRSEEFEGRRIARVEGGWQLLNYQKYRNTLSETDRRDYQRVKQAEYRAKRKGSKTGGSTRAERTHQEAVKNGDMATARRCEELAAGVPPGALDPKALVAEAKAVGKQYKPKKPEPTPEDMEAFRKKFSEKIAAAQAEEEGITQSPIDTSGEQFPEI